MVSVNLWFADRPQTSGIYNVGTGQAAAFNDVARAAIEWHGKGEIVYIPFPDSLKDSYQSFTEADMSALRKAGYDADFMDVAAGVRAYLDRLAQAK